MNDPILLNLSEFEIIDGCKPFIEKRNGKDFFFFSSEQYEKICQTIQNLRESKVKTFGRELLTRRLKELKEKEPW